uniref:Uncharacterized protein n=1 Tax=Arundo donax TaxID=35708 RepID=A0A0A9CRV3_ARUDO
MSALNDHRRHQDQPPQPSSWLDAFPSPAPALGVALWTPKRYRPGQQLHQVDLGSRSSIRWV